MCSFAAVASAGLLQSPHTVAVASPHIIQQDAPAQYDFSYSVHDSHTGDIKQQQESRQGDNVQGQYSLVEPDGSRRVVNYAADAHNGFNAVVSREQSVHPQQVAVAHAAPVAVAHAAPVAVAHAAPVTIAQHASPIAYAQHASPIAYTQHASPIAYAQHASPIAYAQQASPIAYAQHASPLALSHGASVSHSSITQHVAQPLSLGLAQHAQPLSIGLAQHAQPLSLGYTQHAQPLSLGLAAPSLALGGHGLQGVHGHY